MLQTFADKYEALYGKGSAFKEAGVEIGVLRVTAVGTITRPRLAYQSQRTTDTVVGSRDVYWREMQTVCADADLHWSDPHRTYEY